MDYSNNGSQRINKSYKTNGKKIINKVRLIFLRVFFAAFIVLAFVGSGALIGVYMGIIEKTPDINFELIELQPVNQNTIVYENKTGREIDRFTGIENRENAPFERVPQYLKDAFVAIEDERFYQHDGVDYRGIVRALVVAVQTFGGSMQGASTITQQLIKNNLTRLSANSIETKIQEQFLALRFEEYLSEQLGGKKQAKDYILSAYMNTVGMHHGLCGVQTAAGYYFGKDVSELTLAESASLAAITQNPSRWAPDRHPDNNRARQVRVLEAMLRLEFITKEEYDEAFAENIYDRVGMVRVEVTSEPSAHSFFIDQLFLEVHKDLMALGYDRNSANNKIYNGGLSILATIDTEIQKIVDDAYANDDMFPPNDFEIDVLYVATIQNTVTGKTRNLERKKTVKTEDEVEVFIESVKNDSLGVNEVIFAYRVETVIQPQSAFAVVDYHNGHVVAMAGGRGEKEGDLTFNRATQAMRSPGSTFKVLASYAPALDMGLITPATVIDDIPFEPFGPGGWSPKNWYTTGFRGYSNVRRGITNSMNVITVKNMYNTGIDACFEYLLDFGFTTLVSGEDRNGRWLSDRVLSTALGGLTDGVTQVELAAAYGTIANDGVYNKPVYYTKVIDRDGTVLLENNPEPRRVLNSQSAYLLTDMLRGVLTDPGSTGGQARFKESRIPVAGKTGTTTNTNDLMFVGYTPYYAASVWLGFDIQKRITQDNGYHTRLWSYIMEKIHIDLPMKEFERPQGILNHTVCKYSGKLPKWDICDRDPRGDAIISEKFAFGTVPEDTCDVHVYIEIDVTTGMRANSYCPPDLVEKRVGITRPNPEDYGKANDAAYEVPLSLANAPYCVIHTAESSYYSSGYGPNDYNPYLPRGGDGYNPDIPEIEESNPYIPPDEGSGVSEIIP